MGYVLPKRRLLQEPLVTAQKTTFFKIKLATVTSLSPLKLIRFVKQSH
jgi:hypothetical protein